jgi:RimJ/RimL family protein N-acetyltransferase
MNFEFRALTERDLPLLHEWMGRPHVREWWHGEMSLEDVRDKYLPRIAAGSGRPYLAYLDGQAVGYIQSYVAAEVGRGWWPDCADHGVLGIDQFLADAARLGKGLGRRMASQFAHRLFREAGATQIQVDPDPSNARAIRCYTAAGFRPVGPVKTPNGDALLMVRDS